MRWRRRFVVIAVLSLPPSSLLARDEAPAVTIEGRVLDEEGKPIVGVQVTAIGLQAGQDYATTSDAKGFYRLLVQGPGLYVVSAQVTGFMTEARPSVSVPDAGTLPYDLEMRVLTLEELMRIPVVTATKTEKKAVETPAIVSVIDEDEIRDRGYESLAQALRSVPGLSIWEDNLISSIGIRGFNSVRGWSQFLKVMIDGQPVSFRTGFTYLIDEEMIPIRAVKRIEVIRGPASTLYGANAFLGVVNVITRDLPVDRTSRERSVGALGGTRLVSDRGDFEAAGADLLIAQRLGEVGVLAAASYVYADRSGLALPAPVPVTLRSLGDSRNDLARPVSLFGKVGFKDFTLSGNYQRLDSYGEFTDFSVLTHEDRLATSNWYVRGDLRRPVGAKGDLRLFVAYGEGHPTDKDHLDTGSSRFWIRRELGVTSVDAGGELRLMPNADVSLVGGVDYTTDDQQLQNNVLVFKDGSGEQYQNPSQVLGKKRFNNLGAYAQVLGRLREGLELTAGGRFDSHNVYADVFSWRLGGVYALKDSLHLKLLFARSFKAPTPRELFDVAGTSRGNPDLRPQRARTLEAAVEHVQGRFGASVNVFFNHLTDVVALQTPVSPPPGVQKVYANIATIDSYGLESEARYARGGLQGYANLSYQHSEDKATGLATTLVPDLTANLGFGYALSRRLLLNLELGYVGPRKSPKAGSLMYDPPLSDPAGFEVDGYLLSNLTLSTRGLRLFGRQETAVTLGVRNLFDVEYVDPGYENRGIDVPHRGRSLVARLVQHF